MEFEDPIDRPVMHSLNYQIGQTLYFTGVTFRLYETICINACKSRNRVPDHASQITKSSAKWICIFNRRGTRVWSGDQRSIQRRPLPHRNDPPENATQSKIRIHGYGNCTHREFFPAVLGIISIKRPYMPETQKERSKGTHHVEWSTLVVEVTSPQKTHEEGRIE